MFDWLEVPGGCVCVLKLLVLFGVLVKTFVQNGRISSVSLPSFRGRVHNASGIQKGTGVLS